MKLSCLQENLNQGLEIVSHVAAKSANLPILNNILLQAKKEGLKLSATNLEIGVSCLVRAKIEEEGNTTCHSKLLFDYVNLLPNEKIDIRLENQEIKLKCQNFETKIKCLSAEDFPLIPEVEKKAPYICKVQDFKKAISQVIFAASPNEIRPEISGVLLNFLNKKDGVLKVAATDSYRLAEKKVRETVFPDANLKNVIVPAKTLTELLRILSVFKENFDEAPENLEIYISENQILFSYNNVEIVSRIIEGQYPEYEQIIPNEFKTQVVIDKDEFVKAIKAASLFSKSGIYDVNLTFDPVGKITVYSANSQLGENLSKIDAEINGEKNSITLNYRYLLDGLQNIETDEVIFQMTTPDAPCLLVPKSGNDYIYLVMPIKQ
jgi:DNA polymerase-3 subunit beta